jgi:A/G-specific adenine glycosylase
MTVPYSETDFGSLSCALLDWFARNARPMPWRDTDDAYRIWLSEIMLQQTQVATVLPYYHRFLEAFPDLGTLAAASDDAVMKRWEGLGYYSRARNLLACARRVVEIHGGRFPEDPADLESLPGIGRSTAGAVAAIAFGKDTAVLDGNVRRVVSRLAAIGGDPSGAGVRERMWSVSQALVRPGRGRDTALAMMDLGATVCTPRRPRCPACPLRPGCLANAAGNAEAYPGRPVRKARPLREAVAAVVEDGAGRILIRRRPGRGLLGGLWELPTTFLAEGETHEAALRRLGEEGGLDGLAPMERLFDVRHAFTHFEMLLHGWRCRIRGDVPAEAGRWAGPGSIANHAFPRAHQKIIERITEGWA